MRRTGLWRRAPACYMQPMQGPLRITVLTGAGMSAESGIATFRDALTGLWSNAASGT